MRITLTNVSKTFGREQVIRDLSHVFESGSRTAILGPNGSGKSTLLQLVAGALIPTKGSVQHQLNGTLIDQENVYREVVVASPYLNLYEDLLLGEAIQNHVRFKPLRNAITPMEAARIAYLDAHWDKPIRNFSSGMKQRLKLALAILSEAPLLLLDEPASNLDAQATAWFQELLAGNIEGRTLVVASNRQEAEIATCGTRIDLGAIATSS